ncbi:hypothetical protein J7E83_09025 [Arthrobacter sp. ISL-48]|uniref:hypothetical protein n=1 Tax=Arthrobacter sp. ISL-48 TaxID=2819110 RepID=UPI001BEA0185|nr:hypothetical protein [Arthrobacter sp. ISL-48]MBT2532265.1 hypothetical protein [Arthrobacter sp. ISL-48]
MDEATEDWQQLVGCWVELRSGGKLVRMGEVEDVTPDSSVMWLRFNGNHGRQMVAKSDGYEVLPVR